MNDSDYLMTAVKVWAAAAWADGVIVESEALAMHAIIEVAKLTDAQKDEARGWLTKKVALEDLKLAAIPASERLHIYAVACGMIAFDKDIAADERSFLDRLAKALQIPDADAAKARSAARV
jgi:uncharacterized membrane protein YebE (DUF533 family)